MFDMGFLPDLRRILRALPARRQNLMFSATMPPEIRKLANSVLKKPAVVELANARPAETIAHALYPLSESDKIGALERLLAGPDFRSAIVFLRTKRRAKNLAARLDTRGRAAIALQGNMSQGQRERALAGFRDGSYDVLVATDIAARGLDIEGVSHVVNFDLPNTPDAYTHRIGRTGRSERTGKAFTFVTADDTAALRAIEKRLGAPIERREIAELGTLDRVAMGRAKKGPRPTSRPGTGRRGNAAPRRSAARPQKAKSSPRVVSRGAVKATATSKVASKPQPAFGSGVGEAPKAESPIRGEFRGRRRRRRA